MHPNEHPSTEAVGQGGPSAAERASGTIRAGAPPYTRIGIST